MMLRSLTRLARMDPAELGWRAGTAARNATARVATVVRRPRWNRDRLGAVLSHDAGLATIREAIERRDWGSAHEALSRHFVTAAPRFVIAPSLRASIVARIAREFPGSAADAAMRADRIRSGRYDLLGYRTLSFDRGSTEGRPDWHFDPVHRRTAPPLFWTRVPYLDPRCGDHKIIWELNRQQHWLVLGRAYWLTGNPAYRRVVVDQLGSWLDANPPLIGINWASMLELAFRSLSWIWAIQFFAEPDAGDRSPWLVDLLVGLDRQLEQIEHNLSYYFSPNTHLLGEALALYVAGRALPELAGSERRAAIGRRILLEESERQIASDGGHREQSAHYHRYTLDFYLLAQAVAVATQDRAAAHFERIAGRLAFAARVLADDRGYLPHLGDDDGGALAPLCGRAPDDARDSLAVAAALTNRPDLAVGPVPEEAFWLLAHPALEPRLEAFRVAPRPDAVGSTALAETGYYVSRSPSGDHVVIDGGPHGYQNGGHAHADALALTVTLKTRPLLIDVGTGCYTVDLALRDRMRSTALHNTVVVDGRSQSLPSGPFHWAHHADAHVTRWRANSGFDYFDGRHDGYRPAEHRRHVLVLHGDLLLVADLVTGPGSHTAAVHWHFDPRWRVDVAGRCATATAGRDRVDLVVPHGLMEVFSADSTTGLGWQSCAYGRIEPCATVRVSHQGSTPLWVFSAFGLHGDAPLLDAEVVPIWAEAGMLRHSAAIRITRTGSTDVFAIAERDDEAAEASTWRVGDIETDAAALFCRTRRDGQVTRVAIVDGSFVRVNGGRRLDLALPRRVPDLHLDLTGLSTSEPLGAEARISGPGFGARLSVGGRDLPVAVERRGTPRAPVGRRGERQA